MTSHDIDVDDNEMRWLIDKCPPLLDVGYPDDGDVQVDVFDGVKKSC